MAKHYDIVVLGLSLSSSWGNGHATTYRALLRGLATIGQRILFLERDVPWYAAHRDVTAPDYCDLAFYETPQDLANRFAGVIGSANAVIVGSYVPDGIAVLDLVLETTGGVCAFYDIDTPITLAALETGQATYLHAAQIPRLDLYLSFSGGPVLDRLRDRFGAVRPAAFYCAVDDSLYRPTGAAQKWDLGYLGTYSPDRQPALERLLIQPASRLPSMRFVVAGPQYPASISWPRNVERIEHLAPAEHPNFYSAQRFTLNVTRADMIAAGWSPSVRLFEAAACGTPIISDRWPGLTDVLPAPEAIIIADTTDEVVSALQAFPEKRARGMAEQALSIVREKHTGVARAVELRRHLQECSRPKGVLPNASLPAAVFT